MKNPASSNPHTQRIIAGLLGFSILAAFLWYALTPGKDE